MTNGQLTTSFAQYVVAGWGHDLSSITPNSTCSCSGAEQSREGLILTREAPRLQEGLYCFVMLGCFLLG